MTSIAKASMMPNSISMEPQSRVSEDGLPELIRRIGIERDGLRNVTESSLRNEIDRPDDNHDIDHTATKDIESRYKELEEARGSMIQNISAAQNQVLIALDFVSFLLKKDAPRQAELTMSSVLKNHYQAGMLGFDTLSVPPPDRSQVEDDVSTAIGWTFENLNEAANSLLEAATSLEQEAARETRHWADLLSVKEKRWSLCQIPRQRNAIGVRFGFREAGPMFGARGLALLRPNAVGEVMLEEGSRRDPKYVRIRIADNRRVLGDSHTAKPAAEVNGIEARIHEARDAVFEEELFHEIEMEARSLLAHGVRRVSNAIQVPDGQTDRSLILSLENLTSSWKRIDQDDEASDQAMAVALSLRILLIERYRHQLRRRSRPPPLLSTESTSPLERSLLQTLLDHLHTGKVTSVGPLAAFSSHVE